MFFHHRDLAYTVRVDKPNPVFARMLQQAIGGPEGEMRVMNQYMFQGFGHRGEKRYRDMLLSTATEEIGHLEVLTDALIDLLENDNLREELGRRARSRAAELSWPVVGARYRSVLGLTGHDAQPAPTVGATP